MQVNKFICAHSSFKCSWACAQSGSNLQRRLQVVISNEQSSQDPCSINQAIQLFSSIYSIRRGRKKSMVLCIQLELLLLWASKFKWSKWCKASCVHKLFTQKMSSATIFFKTRRKSLLGPFFGNTKKVRILPGNNSRVEKNWFDQDDRNRSYNTQ